MNPLLLAAILLGAGTTAWAYQYVCLDQTRREISASTTHLVALEARLKEVNRQLLAAKRELAERKRTLSPHQVQAGQTHHGSSLPPSPESGAGPASEGFWPPNQPYCYVPKTSLPHFAYFVFRPGGVLSADAVDLLCISPAEERAVNQARQVALDRTAALKASHAVFVETPASLRTENHREISYQIPDISYQLGSVRSDLEEAMRKALGGTRAGLLLSRVPNSSGGARLVTYAADRMHDGTVRHEIRERSGGGSGGVGVVFPAVPGTALWEWRRLFGLEPLLPVPEPPRPQ